MTSRKKSLPDVRVIAGINEDGPFPGGPQDTSILRTFYDHFALKIRVGQETDNLEKAKQILKALLESEGLHYSGKALIEIKDAYNLMCGKDMGISCNWNLDDAVEENAEHSTRKQKQPAKKATQSKKRTRVTT
ncbi:hypothetical protein FRX31_005305 [Thalictrum thalictroides]|uniref:Uncharacterized protein n=1 Tax=Thalictrum thalictroides TaxID=46969 RepID=A0A7J6X7V1_THATH|nr:hypothetical protein FRX31_005305 [Thalictrum thalictroides]